MATTQTDIDDVHDLFAPLGRITTRRMMGGLSIYADGVIFAMLDSDATLYLKAKGAFAQKLADAGARAFTYSRDGGKKTLQMAYWTLPDAASDDPELACRWADEALRSQT